MQQHTNRKDISLCAAHHSLRSRVYQNPANPIERPFAAQESGAKGIPSNTPRKNNHRPYPKGRERDQFRGWHAPLYTMGVCYGKKGRSPRLDCREACAEKRRRTIKMKESVATCETAAWKQNAPFGRSHLSGDRIRWVFMSVPNTLGIGRSPRAASATMERTLLCMPHVLDIMINQVRAFRRGLHYRRITGGRPDEAGPYRQIRSEDGSVWFSILRRWANEIYGPRLSQTIRRQAC